LDWKGEGEPMTEKMRERKFLRKCPCGCGKDEYDLGMYRSFHLYQKPYFSGWWIFAEKEAKDMLDIVLLPPSRFHVEVFYAEVVREYHSLEEAEKSVISQIDNFWERKEALINQAKEGAFQVEPREN